MVRETFADSLRVAVIYPDIRAPYRDIFLSIINGIESRLRKRVEIYTLQKNYDIKAVKNQLKKVRAQVVIALGSRGLSAAKQLEPDFKVVVGAVLNSPGDGDITGISLMPDPETLFQGLKKVIPEVERVTIIYSRNQTEWLIDRAWESARREGLLLNALPVRNIREAAALYRDVLNKLESGKDAIWLPQDRTIDEQTIFPLILQKSWERDLAVFSSNLAHLTRGVLFALYPDNENMGRSLAELALKQVQNGENTSSGVLPLRDLLIAVNTRTAEHLGIKLTNRMKREFDLVFPTR